MAKRKKLSPDEVLLLQERLYAHYGIRLNLRNPLGDPVTAQDVLIRALFDGLVHVPSKRGSKYGPRASGPKIETDTLRKRRQRFEKLMQDPERLEELIRDLWSDPAALMKALTRPGHN